MYRKRPGSLVKHLDFLIIDLIFLLLSMLAGFYIRQSNIGFWRQEAYRSAFLLMALMHTAIATFGYSYRGILRRGYFAELISVLRHVSLVMSSTVVLMFFIKASDILSRLIVGYTFTIAMLACYSARQLWKALLRRRLRSNPRRMLLVADKMNADRLIAQLRGRGLDFELCALVLLGEDESLTYAGAGCTIFDKGAASDGAGEGNETGLPVLHGEEEGLKYLSSSVIDEVLFCMSGSCGIPKKLLRSCSLMGLTTHLEYRALEELSGEPFHEKLAGIDVLSCNAKDVTYIEATLKRLMDIAGGMIGLILTAIITVFLAPAIYISDPGPIFFSQKRVGRNGRVFRIYKFRSMYKDAEQRKAELMSRNEMSGLMFKLDADPRIIGSGDDGSCRGLGHFIRATSLDEFPQFLNVLRGEMSLVGTRPPTLEEYEQYDLHHRARLAAKPGITGLWQISGRSDIKDFEDVVRLDTEYIRTWSIWQDVKILIKTVYVVIRRKGSR